MNWMIKTTLCLAALFLGSGCSLLVDFTECETNDDCGDGICSAAGICEGAPTCTERSECAAFNADAYCLAGQCAVIDRDQCSLLGEVFEEEPDALIIPIGALMPLTGANQDKGESTIKGAELALRQINSTGGSSAGKFGLITCDTTYDPQQAVDRGNYLVDSLGVKAIIGAISSAETIALVDEIAIPKDVLIISPASTASGLSGRSENFWRTVPSDAVQAPAMATLVEKQGAQKVAVLYSDDPYGSGFFSTLSFYWNEQGKQAGSFFQTSSFDPTAKNDELDLEEINNKALFGTPGFNPDTIILIGGVSAVDLIAGIEGQYVKNLSDEDKPRWILSEALRDSSLLEKPQIEPAFDRITGTVPLRKETAIFSNYKGLFQDAFALDPLAFQFPDKAYDAAYLIALAYGAQENPLAATGAQLSAKINLVSGGSVPYNALGNEYSRISMQLRQGTKIDLVGVSSELDFDGSHDLEGATISSWSIENNGTPRIVDEGPITQD